VYYTFNMSMRKTRRERQPEIWVGDDDFPTAASHPFYTGLNQRLAEHYFDDVSSKISVSHSMRKSWDGRAARRHVLPAVVDWLFHSTVPCAR